MQFGIEDLKALPDQTGCWDGVRNYQVERLKPQNQLTKTFGDGKFIFFFFFYVVMLAHRHAIL